MAHAPGPQPFGLPGVLFVDDEADVLAGIRLALRGRPFRIVTARGAAEALEALAREDLAVVVSDERMPHTRGTDLLREVRWRYPHVIRMVLSGSLDPTAIADAINQAGVFRYLLKPCAPADLALAVEQALEAQASTPPARSAGAGVCLDDAIPQIGIHLQPIYAAPDGALFAHEALLRLPPGVLANVEDVLETAEREDRLWEVDRAIRACVAARIDSRPAGTSLFVNLHPKSLLDPHLYADTDPLTPHARAVVIELTERGALMDIADVAERLGALRRRGFRIAIDDMGSGYSGLNSFTVVLPDFVKFDRELIRAVHATPAKHTLVSSIASACAALGIATIAEGIEHPADLLAARSMGCTYVQGYLLARPAQGFGGTGMTRAYG